jgi:hypothetical protein
VAQWGTLDLAALRRGAQAGQVPELLEALPSEVAGEVQE